LLRFSQFDGIYRGCAAGLVVGAGFGVFPASQPTALEIVLVFYAMSWQLCYYGLLFKSKVRRIKYVEPVNIGLVLFGITFFLAIHPLWLNIQLWLNARVNAESITGNFSVASFVVSYQ